MESENILEAKQVSVAFRIDGVLQTAVHHINLEVRRNEVLA
nr:ABC transporter ATP-binding protein [Lactococcus lactis]